MSIENFGLGPSLIRFGRAIEVIREGIQERLPLSPMLIAFFNLRGKDDDGSGEKSAFSLVTSDGA